MIQYQGFGHINIVVDDVEQATDFYQRVLGATPAQHFPHFKNDGFAKSAGFMENPSEVDVCIRFLQIPTNPNPVFVELMQYHAPKGKDNRGLVRTNDLGGVKHIALRVANIDEAFDHVKKSANVKLISDHPDYKPFYISPIKIEDFYFFDPSAEANKVEKDKVCKIVGGIRYFYFVDPYGVQWEFEHGHEDISS
jgi:methylmalonyl-CoA/ethylmalonyl-CoA epimerase